MSSVRERALWFFHAFAEGVRSLRRRDIVRLILLAICLTILGSILQVVAYKFVPVTNTSFMNALAKKNNTTVAQKWVPLEEISTNMAQAVILSEDNRFESHCGFEWDAIKAAWDNNKRGGRKRGGSTISQQTAKNVFLYNKRSWIRKGLEAYYTVLIEAIWGKRRIMEVYLNVIEFGPGVYGAEVASQKFFKHSAKRLTKSEAALMAVVLPQPAKMHVDRPSPYVLRRQAQIVNLMGKTKQWKHD